MFTTQKIASTAESLHCALQCGRATGSRARGPRRSTEQSGTGTGTGTLHEVSAATEEGAGAGAGEGAEAGGAGPWARPANGAAARSGRAAAMLPGPR